MIKQGSSSSPRDIHNNYIFPKGYIITSGRWWLYADHKQGTPDWMEPEDWWLRFLKHDPVISPPTKQKNVQELLRHPATLTSKAALKNPSQKSSRELGLFECELLILLAWHPAINTVLFFTKTSCEKIDFAARWASGPKLSSNDLHKSWKNIHLFQHCFSFFHR